jgi:hypothetical protein
MASSAALEAARQAVAADEAGLVARAVNGSL